MKDIKKAALWGGLVAAGTVVGLACYVCYLGKKTDTNKKEPEFVYHKLEELKSEGTCSDVPVESVNSYEE